MDHHLGVDQEVHGQLSLTQFPEHRIDEERHVVGADLDHCVSSDPAVLVAERVDDSHTRLA